MKSKPSGKSSLGGTWTMHKSLSSFIFSLPEQFWGPLITSSMLLTHLHDDSWTKKYYICIWPQLITII